MEANPTGHLYSIHQGIADGLIAIKGHHCQQHTLNIYKDTDKKELQGTTNKRNGFVLGKNVHQHLGPNCGGIAKIREREVAEKKSTLVFEAGNPF